MAIMTCICENEQQTRIYGGKKRVFNRCGKESSDAKYRCTSCGNIKGGDTTPTKKTLKKK